ncbi:TPR repeat-containing protein DDB_G0287407-like [Ptychodera flava]|uniref:TPR repeat-containing protein DDB_G0287407-like n=1 Tax=Ptychodera flava TaxID=63121 RepID=UPI00396A5637
MGCSKRYNIRRNAENLPGEIDRCYTDNIMPFFLNLTSARCGWIPSNAEVPSSLAKEYKWINGLSVTEMEIMHGAYRIDNPNSLFLIRQDDFLNTIPEEHQKDFVDPNPVAPEKMKILKDMLKKRLGSRVKWYNCQFDGLRDDGTVRLKGLDGTFTSNVLEFYKKRIGEQYPLDNTELDPYQQAREAHESFMKSRCVMVLGRDSILQQIEDYVVGVAEDKAFVLLGGPGVGKSSLMARTADVACSKAITKEIPGGGDKGWYVFYHFVGAIPGSTDLEKCLKRLLKEIGAVTDNTMPTDLESTCQLVGSALTNTNTRPTIIVIDAVNQFDEDHQSKAVSWLPKKLAPQIRVILSMIDNSAPHKLLKARTTQQTEVPVTPLDMQSRTEIVKGMLGKYNKRLDAEQMNNLLSKESSQNPLWLAIACEELRVYGLFHKINDKINTLADGLLDLLAQVLARFEEENGGQLLVATLSLLECSATGLLETELLLILGDEDSLMPQDQNDQEKGASGKESKGQFDKLLPPFKWAAVYRALKPFLRPFGDSGEGRLDFYHRSLSKAVRHKYFLNDDDNETDDDSKDVYYWWHKKLADFFEQMEYLDRKLEEYPQHLIKINDTKRLKEFLTEWRIFDKLYHEEYSSKLLAFWRKAGGYAEMETQYQNCLQEVENDPHADRDFLALRCEHIARVFMQAGRHEKTLEVLRKAMDIEENELGGRPERMVELYDICARTYSEILKLYSFIERRQMNELRPAIEYGQKAIRIRETLPPEQHKFKMGLSLMLLAFNQESWHGLGGDSTLSSAEALKQGKKNIEEAIKIFKELGDDGHVAEAIMTKGVLHQRGSIEQLKDYEDAMDLCIQTYGEYHVLVSRLLLNTGIYYEDSGDYYTAYKYFKRWRHTTEEVFGLEHPKTKRAIDTLEEPMYSRIARELGDR